VAGWAYLIGGIMTVDAALLALILLSVNWPKLWKRR
jgi:hypothetical protein